MNEMIAIIPARCGSKGVKNKNIKLLAGHPLIAYSIAAAKLAAEITIIGPTELGKICFRIIRKDLKPNALPASTYSYSLIDIT